MTRIPREYTAQDHLDMVDHFNFNVSTNPDVVQERQQQRGKGVNVPDDEAAGMQVGTRTLELLRDPELQAIWTQTYSGALLNSALYTLRGVDDGTMSRHFKYTRLRDNKGNLTHTQLVDQDGNPIPNDIRRSATLTTLESTQAVVKKHQEARAVSEPTDRAIGRVGHRLGEASLVVGVFATDFAQDDTERDIMTQVFEQSKATHQAVIQLAHRIGVNPSVMQLRSDTSKLGAEIIHSKAYPGEIKAAFRTAVAEVDGELGYS